jgi:hypothetical protein
MPLGLWPRNTGQGCKYARHRICKPQSCVEEVCLRSSLVLGLQHILAAFRIHATASMACIATITTVKISPPKLTSPSTQPCYHPCDRPCYQPCYRPWMLAADGKQRRRSAKTSCTLNHVCAAPLLTCEACSPR